MDRRQNLTDPASPLVPRPALRRMIGSARSGGRDPRPATIRSDPLFTGW
jgi:hypothetical protein